MAYEDDSVSASPQFTINPDGSFSPPTLPINNGGVVKFNVTYPPGITECTISCTVSFGPTVDVAAGGGTIKVGS